jgi:metallo-beta-lactamase class B
MKPILASLSALLLLIAPASQAAVQPISPGVASVAIPPTTAAPDMQSVYGATPCPDQHGRQSPLCDTHPGPGYAVAPQVEHGGFKMPPDWSRPVPPFRIVGNIYYVGVTGLGAYLFTSQAGLILLDGTLPENAPQIERNIAKLGFRPGDVKILLNSHAHYDHAGGLAQLKRDTGAKLLASAGDRPALEKGFHIAESAYGGFTFPPVRVDGVLVDGQPVRLGAIALTPVITPGHTAGCTSWMTTVFERGRRLRVFFPCSATVAGNKLIGNRTYPGIVGDYRRTFRRLKQVQADVILPPHPEWADVLGRARRAAAGDRDAWLMPDVLPKLVTGWEKDFDAELSKAVAAARH